MNNQAVVISAFPGCGKTFAYTLLNKKFKILDSDDILLDKKGFPNTYISSVINNISQYDIIFVSAHASVRKALNENGIYYTLYYPHKRRKEEFIQNYKDRYSDSKMIVYLTKNYDRLVDEIDYVEEENYSKIILENNDDFILNDSTFENLLKIIKNERKCK